LQHIEICVSNLADVMMDNISAF